MLARLMRPGLLRDAGLYTVFNAAAALFPLLVVPLLTRLVAPADYGIYGVVIVASTLAMPLISMGLETAIGRRFVDRAGGDFPRYVSTALAVTVGLAVAVYAIAFLARAPLTEIFPLPASWFWAWIAIAWSQVVLLIVLTLLQMEQRPTEYGSWRVGRAGAVQVLAAAVALIGFTSWQALVSSMAAANLILTLSCITWFMRRGYGVARFSRADAGDALRYGAPLIPHMLTSAVLVAAAPFFVANLVGLDAVGVYTVGAQIGQVMFMIASSLSKAWVPWFYERMKAGTPEAVRAIMKAGIGLSAGLIATGVAVALAGALVLPLLLGDAYDGAVPVFVWSVAAWTAHGLYGLVSAYLFYTERTAWISAASVVTVVVNIIANPILIGLHGMVGAAEATCLAYAVTLLLGIGLTAGFSKRRAALP